MPRDFTSIAAFLQRKNAGAPGKIALLGCHGTGMTALADILIQESHQLIGFDRSVSHSGTSEVGTSGSGQYLETAPWEFSSRLAQEIKLCIHSPAIPLNDDLLNGFVQSGVPVLSLHQAVNAAFESSDQICVAGTHGKSTTTAMLAWIFEVTKRNSGFFVGARFQHNQTSGRAVRHNQVYPASESHDSIAVIESCEFNRSFHQLRPSTIVLTGLERDHFDCFKDQAEEDAAFEHFLTMLPENGHVVYHSDCKRSRRLVELRNLSAVRVSTCVSVANEDPVGLSYHTAGNESFTMSAFQQTSVGIVFQVRTAEEQVRVAMPVFGRHNASNAVLAMAAASLRGVSLKAAAAALRRFPGLERRFQDRGSVNNMHLIDDYAHHPTAIRTTLQAARKRFPGREIRVCFEPHQLIRLSRLGDEFVDSLSLADTVYVLPVLAARESASLIKCHSESHKLIIRLRSRGTSAFFSPNLDHAVQTVHHSASSNAVLLTMGAGRTHLIHDKLTDRLRRYFVA